MKLIAIFALFFCVHASAGSSYQYVGRARVLSIDQKSKVKTSILFKIEKVLATFGSAHPELKYDSGLRLGEEHLAEFQIPKDQSLTKGASIFFSCGWHCGKGGCSDKSWTLLSEEQAVAKAKGEQ